MVHRVSPFTVKVIGISTVAPDAASVPLYVYCVAQGHTPLAGVAVHQAASLRVNHVGI